jgi:hypothetical protein
MKNAQDIIEQAWEERAAVTLSQYPAPMARPPSIYCAVIVKCVDEKNLD